MAIINESATELDDEADLVIRERAEIALPDVVKIMESKMTR